MHVLIIHQAFADASEPGGTRHYEFARHLVLVGHRVTVLAGRVNYLTGARLPMESLNEQDSGIRIVRPYTYRSLHRSFSHRFLSFLTFTFSAAWAGLGVRGVDIVVGTSPPILQGVTAWVIARAKRVPFVFEVRDLWPDSAIELRILKNRALITLARWLESFLYQKADRLLVNSPGFIPHIESRCGRTGVLIPNGVDSAMFPATTNGAAFRSRWGADGCFVVLYAGAHGMANNLETVLDAANLLSQTPTIRFVFVGDGKEKAALEQLARARGLGNVVFDAAQPKGMMPAVIAASDACIAILRDIPLFRTTYPNKVFDYMAAGKPTVVAIDGVIRRVVEEADGGVFVPPGNGRMLAEVLRRLAADPVACRRMGENARRFVLRRFNRRDQAKAFCALLRECVDEAVA